MDKCSSKKKIDKIEVGMLVGKSATYSQLMGLIVKANDRTHRAAILWIAGTLQITEPVYGFSYSEIIEEMWTY